jgi:hypothetical protein
MAEATDPVPEDPPIVVSANADRMSAVARLLLGAVFVLAVAGAVALPAHDLLLGTMIPRPRGVYGVASILLGLAVLVAGLSWWVARPVSWTIDAGGITQHGPGGRRRDLRWADVRHVQWRHGYGYVFFGRVGLTGLGLPWGAIPKDRRASVLAGVEAILREHFHFPPPPTGGIGRALARVTAVYAVVLGPPWLYLYFLISLLKSRPQTITGWVWVRRLVAWNVDAASQLVPLIFLAPSMAYLGIVGWLVCRRLTRDTRIVPKRPGTPTAA